jgi:hypothetical protein
MEDKKNSVKLSDLTSDVESTSEKDSASLARASAKLGSGSRSSGIAKVLLAIPWPIYLAVGVLGYLYIRSEIEDRKINSFQNQISYYLTRNYDSNSVPSLMPGVLPVDLKEGTVTTMLFSIKDEYKPKSAGDVSFVVGFNCSDAVVGTYSDGASGYQKSCDIYVIDVRSHTWSYAGNFVGSKPPQSKSSRGSAKGSHPAWEYLRRAGVM